MGRFLVPTEFTSALKELLWPTRCVGCDELNTLLCDTCRLDLSWIFQHYACPVCGAPFGWLVCTECQKDWESSTCVSAFVYQGPAARLITVYKDQFELRLAPVLAAALVCALEEAETSAVRQNSLNLQEIDAVTFIPATAEAFKRRGFDHMELVAREVARLLDLPCIDVLVHKEAKDQRSLNRTQRVENMKGTFEVAHDVYDMHILLIDDVITTGASIREATRELYVRGAALVLAASVARTW